MRIALGIEYDGHHYFGWQAQANLNTVQGCLEQALSTIANEPIQTFCAGRTDAGVHALGQVIHFDTEARRDSKAWVMGVNSLLPPAINVSWAQEVDTEFHARFSAQSRRYRYVIRNTPIRSATMAAKVTLYPYKLEAEHMQQAADYLLGEQDFSSFRSSQCESSTPMRNIQFAQVRRYGDYIVIEIQANAFLHHMVRNIVGVLLRIGTGLVQPIAMQEILAAKNRQLAFETAPATGLYLWQVKYPVKYQFPVTREWLLI